MKLSVILAEKGDQVITITPGSSVRELLALLQQHKIGALVVSTDGSAINGIVSERDIVQAIARNEAVLSEPVSAIMTSEVYCAPPSASIDDLMGVMTSKRVRHIPVADEDGLLMGIVSIGDVVKSRLGELEGEKAALVDYITHGG